MEPTERERETLTSVEAAAEFCGIQGTPSDPKTLLGALVALGAGDSLPLARYVVSVSAAGWATPVLDLK
eukprot:4224302-Alexandrium_andersonii.AAC.1